MPGRSQGTRLPLSLREDAHPDPNRYTEPPTRNRHCANTAGVADTQPASPFDTDDSSRIGELACEIAEQPAPSSARVLAAKYRRSRRSYIVAVGSVDASVPRWLSRRRWLDDLSSWVAHDGVEFLFRRVTPQMFLTVAAVLAQFCDSTDGRHCAVTNRTVARAAGCSERTVSTVRSILAEAGFAVLAQQGCGGGGRRHRVAVWHLVSRRAPVDNQAVCELPPSRRDRGLSHAGKNKPKARQRAKKAPAQSKRGRGSRARTAPRPLPVQRLAADLVSRTHGLGHGHMGAICDALMSAGVDPDTTTAEQICRHLDADMRDTGWSWPDEVQRPGAFLAYRLKRIADRLGKSLGVVGFRA